MLKCGLYELDITPPLGCSIPGYFELRLIDDIKSKLYVKSLVIDNGTDVCAICAIDGLRPPHGVHEEVSARLAKEIGLEPSALMINATHAHTGGPVNLPRNEKEGSDERLDEEYRVWLVKKVGDCILLAYKHRMEMTVRYAKEELRGYSFVRNYRMADGTVRSNPPFDSDIIEPYTDIDPDVSLLYFNDKDGTPVGAVVNFACHHDCVRGTALSADYSGILARELKKKYGIDFVTLFLNGFCGNINNWDCIGMDDVPPSDNHILIGKALAEKVIGAEAAGRELADEQIGFAAETVNFKRREILKSDLETAKACRGKDVPFDLVDPHSENFLAYAADGMINLYDEGAPESYDCMIQALRLGDVVLYALPGEQFVQFGKELKANAPTDRVFLAELANSPRVGYIPIKEMYPYPTVYETSPISAFLEADAGDEMTKKALELGKKLFK